MIETNVFVVPFKQKLLAENWLINKFFHEGLGKFAELWFILSNKIQNNSLQEVLNSNFSLTFYKINENLLVVFPILNDVSFRREKSTKADVVLELVVKSIRQFVFIENLLNAFIIFQLILGESIKDSNDFIWKRKKINKIEFW